MIALDVDGKLQNEVEEPSDLELQEIESDSKGFKNLWKNLKDDKGDIDFAFGVNANNDDPEPDYSGLSRRDESV
jgi:hypothetical protein